MGVEIDDLKKQAIAQSQKIFSMGKKWEDSQLAQNIEHAVDKIPQKTLIESGKGVFGFDSFREIKIDGTNYKINVNDLPKINDIMNNAMASKGSSSSANGSKLIKDMLTSGLLKK